MGVASYSAGRGATSPRIALGVVGPSDEARAAWQELADLPHGEESPVPIDGELVRAYELASAGVPDVQAL